MRGGALPAVRRTLAACQKLAGRRKVEVMRSLRLLLVPLLGIALLATGGCLSRSKKKDYPMTVTRFLLEADSGNAGGVVRLPTSGVSIAVEPKSYFTEYDIEACEVVNNELGKALVFKLTNQAGRDLYRLSVPNQGKRIVTMVNARPIGARRIEAPLSQGYILTYVEVPEDQLETLAKNIERTSKDLREELEKKQK